MSSGNIYFLIVLTHWYRLQESLGKAVNSASEMGKYIHFFLKKVSRRRSAKILLLWETSVPELLCSYFHKSFIKKRLAQGVFLQICKTFQNSLFIGNLRTTSLAFYAIFKEKLSFLEFDFRLN